MALRSRLDSRFAHIKIDAASSVPNIDRSMLRCAARSWKDGCTPTMRFRLRANWPCIWAFPGIPFLLLTSSYSPRVT